MWNGWGSRGDADKILNAARPGNEVEDRLVSTSGFVNGVNICRWNGNRSSRSGARKTRRENYREKSLDPARCEYFECAGR
jgi:hypothetical protein